MNNELKNQIESMTENYCSTFMDAYQCNDWGITAQQFSAFLVEHFSIEIQKYAVELDNEE